MSVEIYTEGVLLTESGEILGIVPPCKVNFIVRKPWIQGCCEITCPYCGMTFSDEIYCMGHGKDFSMNYCPVCGEKVDDTQR